MFYILYYSVVNVAEAPKQTVHGYAETYRVVVTLQFMRKIRENYYLFSVTFDFVAALTERILLYGHEHDLLTTN